MSILNMTPTFNRHFIVLIEKDTSVVKLKKTFSLMWMRVCRLSGFYSDETRQQSLLTRFFHYVHELKDLLGRPETLSSCWLIVLCSGSQTFFYSGWYQKELWIFSIFLFFFLQCHCFQKIFSKSLPTFFFARNTLNHWGWDVPPHVILVSDLVVPSQTRPCIDSFSLVLI